MKDLKILIMVCVVAFAAIGCVEQKVYKTGKVVYKSAKTVYVELPIQNDKLELMDKVIVTYDKARTEVINKIVDSKKKVDANTSQMQK